MSEGKADVVQPFHEAPAGVVVDVEGVYLPRPAHLALDQVAGQGGSSAIAVYADSMRHSVDRLQQSSPKDVHAEDAKAAFSAAVSAMTTIDKSQGRTYDVAPMRAIYNRLDPAKPLMPQLGTVEQFFTAAGTALQAMNVPGANAAAGAAR